MEALIDETSGMDLSDSPTAQKLAEKINAEQQNVEPVATDATEADQTPAEGIAEDSGDSTAGDNENRESTDTPPQTETKTLLQSEEFDKAIAEAGFDKEKLIDSVLKESMYDIKVKGKKMKVSHEEMIRLTQLGAVFDKKSQKLSEDAKKGLVISAIEKGDKAAMKKVLELMRDSADKTDFDDLISDLEDIEGNIDEKALEQEHEKKMLFDEAFSDVKKDVDFEKNLNRINSEVRDFIPNEIFQSVLSKSEDFRTMYDIVQTGLWDETKPMFNAKLNALPESVRTEVESNFDLYMDMYATVLKENRDSQPNQQTEPQALPQAAATEPDTESEASTEDVLSSIMSGTRSGGSNASDKKIKNAMDLSKDEFAKMKKDYLDGKIEFKS